MVVIPFPEKEETIEHYAEQMMMTFFANLWPGTTVLAPGGKEELSDIFDEVKEQDRAKVFVRFKELVKEQGFTFDNEDAK